MGEVLTSVDGAFQCTSEHAVSIAYMVSCLEAAYGEAQYSTEVLEVFSDYLRGGEDAGSVIAVLIAEWPEAFPGHEDPDQKDPTHDQ
ncbi:MAG: hypothetical protein ACAH27_06020 [Xanthobacteraceae bacterium]